MGNGKRPPEPGNGPDRDLEDAANSVRAAREYFRLRASAGGELRDAIRRLLDAQEKLDRDGPSPALRLDLLEAIRLVSSIEEQLKGVSVPAAALEPTATALEGLESSNRRAFPRISLSFPILLEPDVQLADQHPLATPISGVTLNLSKGGMLARIEHGILRHGRYRVRFLRTAGTVEPDRLSGVVRHSRARRKGWEVGFQFDDVLRVLRQK